MTADLDTLSGREMDAAIAVEIFGWRNIQTANAGKVMWHESQGTWGEPPAPVTAEPHNPVRDLLWNNYVPDYSTDIAAAWQVVEAFAGDKYNQRCVIVAIMEPNEWRCTIGAQDYDDADASYCGAAPTAPLAICRAALSAARAAKEQP